MYSPSPALLWDGQEVPENFFLTSDAEIHDLRLSHTGGASCSDEGAGTAKR